MIASTHFEWVLNLRDGLPSGNNTVDSLPYQFNLSIESFGPFGTDSDLLSIRSPEGLNIFALANTLKTIPGIAIAESGCCIGDGNDLDVTETDNGYKVVCSYGFGDCLSGCINGPLLDF